MKKILLFCIISIPFISHAQIQPVNVPSVPVFLQDIDGRPLKVKGYDEVEGSPYLYEDWRKGSVRFTQGSVLSGIELKFVLFGNQLLFKKGGMELEFVEPVLEFTLNPPGDGKARTFRSRYPSRGDNDEKTFYEVMVDGKFQLLRFITKQVKEQKAYNEPVKKRFMDKEIWFVFLPEGTLHLLSRDKSDLRELIPAKAELIEKIIDEQKLKLKKDADLVALFEAINN